MDRESRVLKYRALTKTVLTLGRSGDPTHPSESARVGQSRVVCGGARGAGRRTLDMTRTDTRGKASQPPAQQVGRTDGRRQKRGDAPAGDG